MQKKIIEIIMSIETSCDDTSIAILRNGIVISQITHSQTENHSKFGGVIPELAARLHSKNIFNLIDLTIKDAGITLNDLNSIVVTEGPGLINTLQVGFLVAKNLAYALNIKCYKVNHLIGHAFSPFINESKEIIPIKAVVLIVSGGHTILAIKRNHQFEIIGSTRDDAIGEVYDKVGKLVDLEYPGGPIIDQIAYENGNRNFLNAPITNLEKFDFSYSGLKSWVLNHRYENKGELLSSFQNVAIEQLIIKVNKAIKKYDLKYLIIGGGVSANRYLRKRIRGIKNIYSFLPKKIYAVDNAAMIGNVYFKSKKNIKEVLITDDVKPNLLMEI
ncbi:MAG: tRNA N6-adenosine threonylcarbamoyltransferase [Candidatus Hepatoplasma scabrum]|nr:MAG: tRNA N6-adenosine threonylcarbamoyltransferase [Candidatus Hepatoplasma sp.]